MPKIGRKLDVINETHAMMMDNVSRNAPYGNNNTELQRMRIIGGKSVYEKEKGFNSGHKTAHVVGVQTEDENNVTGYQTADHDSHKSHVHAVTSNKSLNPHPIIPPIVVKSSPALAVSMTTDKSSSAEHPHTSGIPVSKTKEDDELTLRRNVAGDLKSFDRTSLKDVYTDLANDDQKLTGLTTSDKLHTALCKAKINIAADDLSRIFSLHMTSPETDMVNYEKVLSFIAACASAAEMDKDVTSHHPDPVSGEMDKINFSYVRKCFEQAARQNNNNLSKDQIKILSDTCGIHFLDEDMDRILDHFKEAQSQYNWQSYLDYLQMWKKHRKTVKNQDSEEELKAIVSLPLLRHPREDKLDALSRQHEEREFTDTHADTQRQAALARQVQIQKEVTAETDSPWFERFMKLANALYQNDAANTGNLPRDEVIWLVSEYNTAYNLGLSKDVIQRAVSSSTMTENSISVDTLLKTLGMCGP